MAERGKTAYRHIPTRVALVALDVVLGLGATGGGWALLTGVIRFPLEWLQGSPFNSYAIPGLALLVLVGGSSLMATVLMVVRPRLGVLASVVAGIILMGWFLVQYAVVGSISWFQPLFIAWGVLIMVLALRLWRVQYIADHA